MVLVRAAVAAVLAASALAAPASASVERCPDGGLGRVVTAGDTAVAVCLSWSGCGEQGVALYLNDQRVAGVCLPFHVDIWWPDPMLCPLFHLFAPGVPGVVDIGPWDGDVSVDGQLVYDCPPYAWR